MRGEEGKFDCQLLVALPVHNLAAEVLFGLTFTQNRLIHPRPKVQLAPSSDRSSEFEADMHVLPLLVVYVTSTVLHVVRRPAAAQSIAGASTRG